MAIFKHSNPAMMCKALIPGMNAIIEDTLRAEVEKLTKPIVDEVIAELKARLTTCLDQWEDMGEGRVHYTLKVDLKNG